jgi:hypothetical protein
MSDQVHEETIRPSPAEAANGELVHWGDPKPLRIGPAGMSATAGVGFALGVVAAVSVLALIHWLGPERVVELPRRRFRSQPARA